LSQGSNSEYRIEVDPDEIPPQIKNQFAEMMDGFSKLESCKRFNTTRSNIVFQLDILIRNKAEKAFDQIVELFESNLNLE